MLDRTPDLRATARRDFSARLTDAYLRAARPSLRPLADRMRAKLGRAHRGCSATALGRVLNQGQFPAWKVAEALLGEFGVPPMLIRGEWLNLWIAGSRDKADDARTPPTAGVAALCTRCSSMVGDLAVHERWHADIELRSR